MEYSTLTVEQLGAVCRISLAREAARNAQSQQMLDELDQALQDAAEDESVRVVVLAGRGAHFSAGHDLKEAQAKRADFTVEERWAYESRRYFGYCMRIWDFPKPTVAQVQGACVAGGFMIANMCDLIVAAEDAFFSDPVGHTLAAAATEVLIHPWVMGLRRAKEMLFTGEKLEAQEACASAWSTAWCRWPSWRPPPWRWRSASPRRRPSGCTWSSVRSIAPPMRKACALPCRRISTRTSSRI